VWCVSALWVSAVACRSGRVPEPAKVPRPATRLSAVSPSTRLAYLKRAQVWAATPTSTLDLGAGPAIEGAFPMGAEITCDYDDGPHELGGVTPKFFCRRGDDLLKVRYGPGNGEVYAAVAASRLFWALGFRTDAHYPVRVTCRNCPIDPWMWKTPQRVPQQRFDPATVERRLPGVTIESREAEGWKWSELDDIDPRMGGAPLAHRDALKLLAVFVQHGDNGSDQQRLVCLPEGVRRGPEGETCTRPFLVVHDLGATFGGGGRLTRNASAKLQLNEWSQKPIFKDREKCIANLRDSVHGDLHDPQIHEAGRRFLTERLALLSRRQIRDLFTAARVEEHKEMVEENGRERPVTVDDWVAVFLRKRAEIASERCPD
jgi:hypothetical protein